MRLPIHFKIAVLEFKKKYLWFLWSRDSNMTQKTNISTILENIFQYENVTLKLKFWAISFAQPSLYSFTTNFCSQKGDLIK